MATILRIGLFVFLVVSACLALTTWAVPVETAQQWAAVRTQSSAGANAANAGLVEAVWWFVRMISVVVLGLSAVAFRRRAGVARFVANAFTELVGATEVTRDGSAPGQRRSWQSCALRGFIAAWLALAVYHGASAVWDRLKDWPVYRFQSSSEFPPNMSGADYQVLRFLEAETPPGSRIVFLSDQRLYLLSYYLLPRRLFQPMPEGSEWAGDRFSKTYRLSTVDRSELQRLNPDYVVEYVEVMPCARTDELPIDSRGFVFPARHIDGRPGNFQVLLYPYAALVAP